MNDQNTNDQWTARNGALKPHAGQPCPFAQIKNVMSTSCRNGHCAASFVQKVLPKKSVVVAQGAKQDGLIAVVEGVLKLSTTLRDGRTQIVGLKFPGEIVTTRSLGDPWFATAAVVQDAVLCFLDAPKVANLKAENPDFDRQMHDHAAREVAAMQSQLVTIGRKLPAERLASFLMELDQRFAAGRPAPNQVSIPITRDDIGDYLGLESETVSRQFTRLRISGVIEMASPGKVEILDREAIQRLSEGDNVLPAD